MSDEGHGGSTLSGLHGIEKRVTGSVRMARSVGELELAAEGAKLLADSDELHKMKPGDARRAEAIRELMTFEKKALAILAKYV